MVSQAQQRLSDDHHSVSEVLKQLLAALDNNDVHASHAKLDLLWARLAVHIRAEHLHLFPTVINHLAQSPDLIEARLTVETLREDHDFFMRELAQAIAVLRELSRSPASYEAGLKAVRDAVRRVENRLVTHNQIEEDQIYGLAGTILTEPEQMELATQISAELENRPPRFSAETW